MEVDDVQNDLLLGISLCFIHFCSYMGSRAVPSQSSS